MTIRYVVDEDTIALGKALVELRDDVTYVGYPGDDRRGRPPCAITLGMKDEQWLPIAADQGLAIITRDKKIRTRPGERLAVQRHGLLVFAITSPTQLNRWQQMQTVVRNWPAIEAR